jgi:hypothetical protein
MFEVLIGNLRSTKTKFISVVGRLIYHIVMVVDTCTKSVDPNLNPRCYNPIFFFYNDLHAHKFFGYPNNARQTRVLKTLRINISVRKTKFQGAMRWVKCTRKKS